MLRSLARVILWVPERIGKLLRPGVLALLAAAGSSLRRGNTRRGVLLVGLALVSTVFKRLSYVVYGLLALNVLRKRLGAIRRSRVG